MIRLCFGSKQLKTFLFMSIRYKLFAFCLNKATKLTMSVQYLITGIFFYQYFGFIILSYSVKQAVYEEIFICSGQKYLTVMG